MSSTSRGGELDAVRAALTTYSARHEGRRLADLGHGNCQEHLRLSRSTAPAPSIAEVCTVSRTADRAMMQRQHALKMFARSQLDQEGIGVRTLTGNEPLAFFSYAHRDDEHENGLLSRLRESLQGEATIQLGVSFTIFQDRTHLKWGNAWRRCIDDAIGTAAVLLPVVTPTFFRSEQCRREVLHFREYEERIGRNDLILPIYYISVDEMEDPELYGLDNVASILASRQYVDWRELRFKSLGSGVHRRKISTLAVQLVEASKRSSIVLGRASQKESAPGSEVEGGVNAKANRNLEERKYGFGFNTTESALIGRAHASLVDAYWDLFNFESAEDSPIPHLESSIHSLAEAFNVRTGATCAVSIKLITASALDMSSYTLVGTQLGSAGSPASAEQIVENADFAQIFIRDLRYYFSDDTRMDLSGNSNVDQQGTRHGRNIDYLSTIVCPIERRNLSSGEMSRSREILGLLCIDSTAAHVFREAYDVPIAQMYCQWLHLVLHYFRRVKYETDLAGRKRS